MLRKIPLPVVVLCVTVGCAQTAFQQAKVVGLAAKETAEAAYLTVRTEYLLGHVDEATMERARTLYARFALAQEAYINALRLWETAKTKPTDLAALREDVTSLAASLQTLAREVASRR